MSSSTLKPAAESQKQRLSAIPMRAPNIGRAREALAVLRNRASAAISSAWPTAPQAPPGGEVKQNYVFEGENGSVFRRTCSATGYACGLQLHVRAQRERPCRCALVIERVGWRGAGHLQRVALAVVARSPIERLKPSSAERAGIISAVSGPLGRVQPRLSCADKDGGDDAAFNVSPKRDGTIRQFLGAAK